MTTSTTSPSPRSRSPDMPSHTWNATDHSQSKSHDTLSSHSAHRASAQSHASELSTRAHSSNLEYPAFASALPYALVRDFAYPVFHPLHYGAPAEPSRSSTPTSDYNGERRRSDPMEDLNHVPSSHGGWTAGPWGGDGVMFGDPEHDDGLAALPSTSFGSGAEQGAAPLEFGDDEGIFKRGKHRKSKSYGNIADFERGRRRESGRRSRGDGGDTGIFYFQGQPNDPRRNRGYSGAGTEVNGRRDSPFAATTLPNRSFHNSYNHHDADFEDDEDEQIPLDTEPNTTISPQRDSMGPEDEELFAGPSLALYSFEPENSNELRLDEGQEIMVSYRHGQGWLVASDPFTGEQGLVPEAYVRLIADMPNYDPERGEFVDLDEFEDGTETSGDFPLDREAEEWSNEISANAKDAVDVPTDADGQGGDARSLDKSNDSALQSGKTEGNVAQDTTEEPIAHAQEGS